MNYKVVIPSASAGNLARCVQAIMENEPDLPMKNIIVMDDGAKEDASRQLPGITWLEGVKPFVYARNTNLGMRSAQSDVILLNDDAKLLTPFGFRTMSRRQKQFPGLISASIHGVVCNRSQLHRDGCEYRVESEMLAFICVYVPQWVQEKVGLLDERFDQYGYEDTDYCLRCKEAGVAMGILDCVVVDHSGLELASTFRSKPNLREMLSQNEKRFRQKWSRECSDQGTRLPSYGGTKGGP